VSFWTIHQKVLVTNFIAAFPAGSGVACQNFVSISLCINSLSKPESPRFPSDILTVLVDNPHFEAIEAASDSAALSAFICEVRFSAT
jgi:hypothetical protein